MCRSLASRIVANMPSSDAIEPAISEMSRSACSGSVIVVEKPSMTSIVPGGMSDAAELAIKARAFAAASGLASTANTFEAPARAAKRASTANGPVPRSRTTQSPACARTLRLIASPKADVRASSCSIASYISSVKLTNAAAPSTEGCHELPSSFDSIDEVHDRGAVQAIATATVALEPRTGQQATATDSIGVQVPALIGDLSHKCWFPIGAIGGEACSTLKTPCKSVSRSHLFETRLRACVQGEGLVREDLSLT